MHGNSKTAVKEAPQLQVSFAKNLRAYIAERPEHSKWRIYDQVTNPHDVPGIFIRKVPLHTVDGVLHQHVIEQNWSSGLS